MHCIDVNMIGNLVETLADMKLDLDISASYESLHQ